MRKLFCLPRRRLLAAVAVAVMPMLAAERADGGVAFALTSDDQLLQFDTSTPGTINSAGPITGLNPFESLLGIDFRPADPTKLFAVSSFGQTYSINPLTRLATKIGVEADPVDLPLTGEKYGLSFNPVVDRIRLVSDLSENYRINPNDGTAIIDGALAYAAGDVNAAFPPGVSAVAYTNQNTSPAATTELYGIDSEAGVLVEITSPNAGTLSTVGSLNQPAFPLFSALDIEEGTAYGFTTFEPVFGELPSLSAQLFGIDLATGQATSLGLIGDGSAIITGGAVTATAVPLPPALALAPVVLAMVGYFQVRARRRQATAMD